MESKDIFSALNLDSVILDKIKLMLTRIDVAKGEQLLKPNETVHYQYYLASGCLRSYFVDHIAKEHTVQFAIRDWWISDYTAFYKQDKSILWIECIQPAELYRLSRSDMYELFNLSPAIERFFRIKTESFISSFQKRIIGDLAKSAKERYLDFINAYPNIEQLVKNYHIASYLGITSESLSRVRKELVNT